MNTHSRRTALALFGTSAISTLSGTQAVNHNSKVRRPAVEHFATTTPGELIDSITLTGGRPYRYTSLYILKFPNLMRGDIVQAHCQFEIANNVFRDTRPNNVMCAHAMLMHAVDKPLVDEQVPQDWEIVRPCAYAGDNITPGAHYAFRSLFGSVKITEKTTLSKQGDLWISVIVYAASSAKGFVGQKLDVQQGYGGLSALVFRESG